MAGALERGRQAFARRAWSEARTHLESADLSDVDDVERLAMVLYLVGADAESLAALERVHATAEADGDHERAARAASWIGLRLLLQGEEARAGGWLARADRLLSEAGRRCAARGLRLVPAFLASLHGGDPDEAAAVATEIVEIGLHCRDKDVLAFGLLCQGEASLAQSDVTSGMKQLDEAMLSVTTGEVSPVVAGIVYCAVIEACIGVFDVGRAAEWTDALYEWCQEQPDLVPYRGQCLVHRAQVLQARGTWEHAMIEAEQARVRLSDPLHPALGMACYQEGELHRLRGEFGAAEQAYRTAAQYGREPAPGIALLRLAEGNVAAARAAIVRMAHEREGSLSYPLVAAAAVEILLAAGAIGDARAEAEKLRAVTDAHALPLLQALTDCAWGSVLLAEGDATGALAPLRAAWSVYNDVGMPYDAARTRVLIAQACAALADRDAAAIEFDAARATFARLGAAPDLERIDALQIAEFETPAELTPREVEVLRLVATGRSNREIASDLVISEHTVARHLQNMFVKLDLPSRAAATAYAYEHRLV